MSAGHESPLLEALIEAGGVVVDYHGRRLVRHFGEPADEYRAASEGLAVFDRSHRVRLRVSGRAPAKMLHGVLTGVMPADPVRREDGVWCGVGSYHTVLTPKGRMVSDLWAYLRTGGDEGEFLFDVPVAGAAALVDQLSKVLPPRFAAVEDVSTTTAMITVAGPEAAAALSRLAFGLRVEAHELEGLEEGEWRISGESTVDGVLVTRTGDIWSQAYNVMGPKGSVVALWAALVAGGGRPAGLGVWSTLHVEGGRPVFGTDMDDTTIPVEAGIHDRAIDYDKGCYTGQEVIVRIRDRGHVNRHLRRIHLGDVPAPAKGTELTAPGSEKTVAWVTSSVQSPRFGETIALAYVRRGVEELAFGDRTVQVPVE